MKALIIVDVQTGFLPDAYQHLPSMIADAAIEYDLIVATQFINAQDSLFRTQLGWHEMGPDDPNTELAPDVAEVADEVIRKSGYGLPPSAVSSLIEQGVTRVDVCGLETDHCVPAVGFTCFDAGLETHIREDLCAVISGNRVPGTALDMLRRAFEPS